MNAPHPSHWDLEKLFYQHEQYFLEFLRLIQSAKKTIEIETYIFQYDSIGIQVLDSLVEASSRGVDVRVIIDGAGSRAWLDSIHRHLGNSKVKIKVYHPIPFAPRWSTQGSELSLMSRAFFQLNKRMHRKVCFIDHDLALVGSFNVCDRKNRDTAILVRGHQSHSLLNAFENAWDFRWKSPFKIPKGLKLVQLNNTQRLRRHWNKYKINKIYSSQKMVWVASAYFVPPITLLRALCSTARRGIDIRILIPFRSDHFFMKIIAQAYYKTLLLNGVRVFEYQPLFLHSKTILIDDFGMVGSSNLNYRSIFHDLEVDLVLTSRPSISSLREQYEKDLKESIEIKFSDLKKGSVVSWFLQSFFGLFRNWV